MVKYSADWGVPEFCISPLAQIHLTQACFIRYFNTWIPSSNSWFPNSATLTAILFIMSIMGVKLCCFL